MGKRSSCESSLSARRDSAHAHELSLLFLAWLSDKAASKMVLEAR
jgi:hypothetical protein